MHSNWLKAVFLQLDGNMASFNIIITSELHIYIYIFWSSTEAKYCKYMHGGECSI